ncbi:MarR family winged helix-turn-helix transcriptional regulator [Mesorhizobium xinjiangense]|uniref:MarR family winged helix-turn-helix transcriptional regulator n=1 Tax=Mesorhizobium xinjiangense TaxID=2678685 RepID=UPI0018DB2CB7|nr:MarR family winged helix-turn-helix transcriptional regulator [Mesorhizobium xinjiangense]
MDRIEECISFQLGKAYQQITRRAREALAMHGITPVQYATLCVLWERDGLSCADLCARLILDSATMTGIVDRLETAGCVERRRGPDGDRRLSRVYLTASGNTLREPLQAAMDAMNREIDAHLGQAAGAVRRALTAIGASSREAT